MTEKWPKLDPKSIELIWTTVRANWLRAMGFLWSKMVEFRSLFLQFLAKFLQIDYGQSKVYSVNFTSNGRSLLRSSQLFNRKRRKREQTNEVNKSGLFAYAFLITSLCWLLEYYKCEHESTENTLWTYIIFLLWFNNI